MKARILTLNSDEHQVAQELLPWFVNGTLDTAEASRVMRHMAQCSLCQVDAAAQAEFRAAQVDGVPGGNADLGWAALRSKLDQPRAVPRRPDTAVRPWWRHGLQLAVAFQAAVLLVLSVTLVSVLSPVEPYRALAATPAAAEPNALVVFWPDATSIQMSAALRAASARIVGGPTVTEAYLLRVPGAGPDALTRLRAQPGVLKAESLHGETAR